MLVVTLTLGGSEATTKEEDLILILQRILKDSLIYLSMLPFSYKTLELVANQSSAKRTKSENYEDKSVAYYYGRPQKSIH